MFEGRRLGEWPIRVGLIPAIEADFPTAVTSGLTGPRVGSRVVSVGTAVLASDGCHFGCSVLAPPRPIEELEEVESMNLTGSEGIPLEWSARDAVVDGRRVRVKVAQDGGRWSMFGRRGHWSFIVSGNADPSERPWRTTHRASAFQDTGAHWRDSTEWERHFPGPYPRPPAT